MENYVAFIVMVAIGFGVLDLLTDRWPRLQRQIFPIVMLLAYFLLIIRYYYGPDIWTYVPHYENIPRPARLISHPEMADFELGYDIFCSVMHWMDLSYWGMTVVITTLYFIAITMLIRQLPKRQIFALACIIMIDSHMVINENRECLAISCFIFMVLLLRKRWYIMALAMGACTVLTHKSGFLPVSLLLIGSVLYHHRQDARVYVLMTLVLLMMILLPVQRISDPIVQMLPLPEDYLYSLRHHLSLGKQIQVVAIVYLVVLIAASIFTAYGRKTRYTWIAIIALIGMACVVLFYQYYFLLSRIRSYFVPFVVCYLIWLLSDEERSKAVPYSSLIKQSVMVVLLVYYSHTAYRQIQAGRLLHEPMPRACTVFELRKASSKQIRDRQMKFAYDYWTKDFMKNEDNKL